VGYFTIAATAKDAADNTKTVSDTLHVIDPNDQLPPVVSISSPAVNAPVITAPVDVVGSVTDPDNGLSSWKLDVLPIAGTWFKTIATGTQPITNGVIGQFDPTLLANDSYILRLTAEDNGGHVSSVDREVQVAGHLKLGNFTVSFTDLTIPVAGIPITVTRTYDTLDANEKTDLGYGWRLNFGDAKLKVDLVEGASAGWGGLPAFLDGTRVYVTNPDGDRQGYTFQPYEDALDDLGLLTYWHPYFKPDSGNVDDLEVPDVLLNRDPDSGEYFSYDENGIHTYNPADSAYGGVYTLVDLDGIFSDIDATTGKLRSMRNRNGNKLTFTPDAIESNTGRKVAIQRDPQGRIVKITDPRGLAGDPGHHYIEYGYSADGDLITVTDRMANTTAFKYRTDIPHYLDQVKDPLNQIAIQTDFAADNRIKTLTDAANQSVQMGFDIAARSETVTDQVGKTATEFYDQRGNVIQEVNAEGEVQLQQYAPNSDFQTSSTLVVGLPDDPSNGENDDLTTHFTVDSVGHILTQTDPLGQVDRFTYNQLGLVQTASDSLGNTVRHDYDERGNPKTTTDPLGNLKSFGYDSHGNLESFTTVYRPDFGGQQPGSAGVVKFTYNQFGDAASVTDTTGVSKTVTSDADGNLAMIQGTWVNPDDPSDQRPIVGQAIYDPDDRLQEVTTSQGTVHYQYDFAGNETQVTSPNGTEQAILDVRGKVIQTTSPDGRVSQTVYDAKGRAIWETDAHAQGQPAHGTRTYYDGLDRVKKIERYAEVLISVVQQADGSWQSQLVSSAPSPFATSTSQYNRDGTIAQATDFAGHTTSFEYDKSGRQTVAIDLVNGEILRTEFKYDPAGRKTLARDALGRVTRYQYDDDGRLVKTIYPDNSFTATDYDMRGQVTCETDQLGRTTNYEYDKHGNLTAVILPEVFDPERGMRVRPRYEYDYDMYGDRRLIRDPKGRETTLTFDENRHETSRTLPQIEGESPRTEHRTYTGRGLLQTVTDFKGQVLQLVYDAQDRVDLKEYYTSVAAYQAGNATETVDYAYDIYDDLGRHEQVIDARGTTDYLYDSENRLVRIASPEGTVDYEHDPATGRRTRTSSDNSDIRFCYDELGRMTTVTVVKQNGSVLPTPQVTTYAYDEVGNLISVQLPNGVATTTYQYDALNRVTDVVHKDALDAVFASYHYDLLLNGERERVTESRRDQDNSYSTTSVQYTYDDLNRLTSETYDSSLPGQDYVANYVFDIVGNRLEKSTTLEGGPTAITGSQFNALDQLVHQAVTTNGVPTSSTDFGYDLNGSLISESTVGGASANYTYNLQNQLATATIDRTEDGHAVHIESSYAYNSDGIRVRSDITTSVDGGLPTAETKLFLIDPDNATGYAQVLEELPSVGTAPDVSYAIGLDVLSQASSSATRYFLADGQGSTRLLIDSDGSVTAHYDYDAYGNLLGTPAGILTPATTILLYTGEQFDPNLGTYYLRARYYDPATGRFTQMDPFQGRVGIPQSLHKYIYVSDNPLNAIDPSGRDLISMVVSIGVQMVNTYKNANGTRKVLMAAYKNIFRLSMIGNLIYAFSDPANWLAVFPAAGYQFRLLRQFNRIPDSSRLRDLAVIAEELARAAAVGIVLYQLGIKIKPTGFPDFSGFRHTRVPLPIFFTYRGSRGRDETMARRLAGITPATQGTYTWHHHEVVGLFELVQTPIHVLRLHSGGIFYYKICRNLARYD
jgi:RHS repeat-associated protein